MLVFKCLWFGGLDESAWLGGHFSYYLICSKVFLIGNIFFDDPQVHHSLKVILNKCVDFDDPKEFDDSQIFDDPKGISIGSMDFDNPKIYDDTFIFDGFVVHGVFTICKVTVCLPVHL